MSLWGLVSWRHTHAHTQLCCSCFAVCSSVIQTVVWALDLAQVQEVRVSKLSDRESIRVLRRCQFLFLFLMMYLCDVFWKMLLIPPFSICFWSFMMFAMMEIFKSKMDLLFNNCIKVDYSQYQCFAAQQELVIIDSAGCPFLGILLYFKGILLNLFR